MRGDARLKAACGLLWLLSLILFTETTPLNRDSRMVGSDRSSEDSQEGSGLDQLVFIKASTNETQNGCNVGDILYQYGETVPGSGPCEKCLCDRNGVSCSPVQCQVKAGCKALHRADHCCPLYQCECERNGTIYSNGEKLVDPNPCQVCYCQGGEIVCNQIACFRRHDCEPLYVPGRCCPEYDHCPPREKDIENHIPQSDSSSSTSDKHKLSNKDTTVIEKVITSSGSNLLSGNNINNLQSNNNDYQTQSGSVEEGTNKPVIISMNDLADASKNNLKNKPEKSQTINIKEVTGMKDKPINEIRIKEILPASSYDASLTSTKSPTIPREVNKAILDDFIIKEDVTVQPEENQEYQTPPVLRIGDQLLFLNVGDLVPENAAVNTPSSVFTVIGAEGLQRGVEDQEDEETLSTKTDLLHLNGSSFNESFASDLNETLIFRSENDTDDLFTDAQTDILRSSTTDFYGGITLNPSVLSSNYDLNSTDDSIESTTSSIENNSEKLPESVMDEEQQSIPIEHLPEHNPEYPPIPEDIMILSMTEEPVELGFSEIDFSGVNPAQDENKDDQKIKIVKRPVMPLPPISKQNKHISNDKESKIILEVLHAANNKTNSTSTVKPLIPEEWLKTTPIPETVSRRLNSPLIDLNLALPDSILNADNYNSDSSEEDNREYIFVTNDTLNANFSKYLENETENSKNEIVFSASESLFDTNNEYTTISSTVGSNIPVISFESLNDTQILLEDMVIIPGNDTNEPEMIIEIEMVSNETNVADKIDVLNEYATVENVQEFTDDTITNLIISTEKSIVELSSTTEAQESNENKSWSPNKDSEVINNFNPQSNPEFFENPSVKQKKTPVADSKPNERNKSKKQGDIFADLISLVGDVASIGAHDVEVSSVHNSLEFEKYTDNPFKPQTEKTPPILHISTSAPDIASSASEVTINHANVELSEYHPGDIHVPETTTEHEKIEFTTKKITIDKDSDERNKWKSTDHIFHEIEIIPKLENNVGNKKNQSLEKIIKNNENPTNVISKEKSLPKEINRVNKPTVVSDGQAATKKIAPPSKPQRTTAFPIPTILTEPTTRKSVTTKLKPVSTSTSAGYKIGLNSTVSGKVLTQAVNNTESEVPTSTVRVTTKTKSTTKTKNKPTKLSASPAAATEAPSTTTASTTVSPSTTTTSIPSTTTSTTTVAPTTTTTTTTPSTTTSTTTAAPTTTTSTTTPSTTTSTTTATPSTTTTTTISPTTPTTPSTTTTTAAPSTTSTTTPSTTTANASLELEAEDDISSQGEADTQTAKRETDYSNVQTLGEQKETSLMNILKDFVEKQYRQ